MPLHRSPQRPQRSQTATISALADILAATAHNADAPRPPPIIATESNRASPRRDATATANSATYQSQDSQDSEPDTPLLPGCSVMAPPPKPDGAASPAKLAIGVVGIFGAFLYYGQLMGDIVKYQADDGSKLEREWFLQVLEAAANVLVGLAGLILTQGGPSPAIPYKSFLLTGSTQVLAKAMTQKAQIYGVPFFLATLVKNAKMVPVMIGAIVLARRDVMTKDNCQDVEVVGWLYQFYISEKKDEVFEGLKKNQKVKPENIPAATQLFTPHWIVRYLVENSLGRLWMLNHPNSSLIDQMEYYIAPEEPETDYLKITSPEEIKICDPACGSGHMLTYSFDLLYAI